MEYARALAESMHADTVTVHAISPDGNTVEASFLLNHNSVMIVETTHSDVDPPNNDGAVNYMRSRIDQLVNPRSVEPETIAADLQDYDG